MTTRVFLFHLRNWGQKMIVADEAAFDKKTRAFLDRYDRTYRRVMDKKDNDDTHYLFRIMGIFSGYVDDAEDIKNTMNRTVRTVYPYQLAGLHIVKVFAITDYSRY